MNNEQKLNIVVLDGICLNPGDLSWDGFKQHGQVTVYDRTAPTDVLERAKDADVIITNKVVIDEALMAQLPRLRYIGVLATGYNIIDIEGAHRHHITVTNIPAYSTDSVAQMTFAHILNITNRVDHYAQDSRQGKWAACPDFCYWDTPLRELAGKTLGVVGLGNIGMKVARIAHEFGMDVFALTSKNAADLPDGIQKTTLDGLLATSDILSLHCPLTPDTHHLINADTLGKMKSGAILINLGRGPLVDEQAVAEALHNGHLAAYGTDVMEKEPPAADNPLFREPHAYVTPHVAWATLEARQRLMQIAVDNLGAFLNGNPKNSL